MSFVSGPGLFNKENGDPCSIQSIDHRIIVEDGIALFSTTQKFLNESKNPVEMLYRFPLLNGTSPHKMEFEIFDPETKRKDLIKAKIEEKKIALEKYDDAIAEGNSAVLMEKDGENFGSLSLGNIQPKNEISIFSEICQGASMEVDQSTAKVKMSVLIPSMHNRKDEGLFMSNLGMEATKVMSVDATIRIHINREVEYVRCTSHFGLITEKIDDKEYRIFTKERVSLDHEMNLEIGLNSEQSKNNVEMIQGFASKVGNDKYAAYFSMLPNFTKEHFEEDDSCVPIEHILLIDRSGSMSGDRIKFAQQAVKLFIKSLDMDDFPLINVIGFGSKHEYLFEDSVPLDEYSYDMIHDHVCNDLRADLGGTNISGPLRSIAQTPLKKGWLRIVYLFTDGEPINSNLCTEIAMEHKVKFRIFSFGIGKGINESFLTNLSKITNGRAVFISKEKMIRSKVVQQMNHSVSGQMIRQFNFDFMGIDNNHSTITNVSPSDFLFNLQGGFQCFFLKNITEETEKKMIEKEGENEYFEVKVSYRIGAEDVPKETTVKCRILKNEDGNKRSFVGVFAAAANITRLEQRKKIEKKNVEIIEKEIFSDALEFSLLSSKTSFIGVKQNDEDNDKNMLTSNIETIPYQETVHDRVKNYPTSGLSMLSPAPMPSPSREPLSLKKIEKVYDENKYFEPEFTLEPIKKTVSPVAVHKKLEKQFAFFAFNRIINEKKLEEEPEEEEKDGNDNNNNNNSQYDEELFYDILDLQRVKGNWDERVIELLFWSLEKVKTEAQQHGCSLDQLITGLIIIYLKTKYSSQENEWTLLIKKSLKFIQNDSKILKLAEKVLPNIEKKI